MAQRNMLQQFIKNADDFTGGGVKAFADLGTLAGNGLLLGQGAAVKALPGYAARKATNALGLTEGDVTLADLMKPTSDAIARARESAGTAGRVTELGAGLIAGGGLPGALMRGGKAIAAGSGAMTSALKNVIASPVTRQAAVGGAVYGGVNSIMDDPSDPQTGIGSKQPGPAAAAATAAALDPEAAAAAAATSKAAEMAKARQTIMKMNSGKFARFLEMQKLRPPQMKPDDVLKARRNQLLDAMYNQGMSAAGDDPVKQSTQSMETLKSILAATQPSGVVYLPQPEE